MSHIKELKELAAEYPQIRFVGVNSNTDESPKQAHRYFQSQELPFPVLKDEKAKLADEMRATKTPHVFVLKNDKILFQGGVSNSAKLHQADRFFLREALGDIHAGRAVKTPLARALGCAIERTRQPEE
jgi:hypothetical protein